MTMRNNKGEHFDTKELEILDNVRNDLITKYYRKGISIDDLSTMFKLRRKSISKTLDKFLKAS